MNDDLVAMGIMKRKLTKKEAERTTKEVMAIGLKDAKSRFELVVMKAIELTNKPVHKKCTCPEGQSPNEDGICIVCGGRCGGAL